MGLPVTVIHETGRNMNSCLPKPLIKHHPSGVVILAMVSGCSGSFGNVNPRSQPSVDNSEPASNSVPQIKAAEPRAAPAAAVRRLVLHVDVVCLEGPSGTFSMNDRLWELLNEFVVRPRRLLAHRDNGFRYGVCPAGIRPALQSLLSELPGLRTAQDSALPRADRPVEIELAASPCDLALFWFDSLGHMRGASFEAARPFFLIDFKVDAGREARVRLRIVPEIRQASGPMRYVRTTAGYRRAPTYRGRVFESLGFSTELAAGEVFVVGPTPDARQAPMLGRTFMTNGSASQARENLYLFIPRTEDRGVTWLPASLADAWRPQRQ
ncbi:MAG: hypothetical protein V3T70_06765 [Phycisphaerae bacterium]